MASSPKAYSQLLASFPAEHVLLVTFNRPKALNAMTPEMTDELQHILDWFEEKADLWCACTALASIYFHLTPSARRVVVFTGAGRIFCAGADLIAWNKHQQSGESSEQARLTADTYGFGSISRRQSRKPMIAAVNGGAYGGGTEIVLNCDLVVAGQDAKFALPEVKRGVIAAAGGIARVERFVGHQLAAELLLLGKTITAEDARGRFGFVNVVVPAADVVSAAVQLARDLTQNSPEAVQSTKRGLLMAQNLGLEDAYLQHTWVPETTRVFKGDNIKEGLRAFSEKRSPKWGNPAKL
ncbi:ClpP/crotonase-like domain-containing protein [Schizophyllum amplum]|uniref:ClpP/crotonase-like domain-containing protein n=1 Tax=Schizophyllum amplum TaxID=97359 RepID=A0A550CPK9_9AGAR|nr:ClpP/crotonase-like domain-containing protein [Auriculariopsis ampla]